MANWRADFENMKARAMRAEARVAELEAKLRGVESSVTTTDKILIQTGPNTWEYQTREQ